jgi:NDP-sugar pyrophosphorylase family protein
VLPLAVILAGGLGTRLGALAQGLPKPMVPVAGVPFLDHVLRQLAGQGFKRVLLLVGYKASLIQDRYGDGTSFGLQIAYSTEPEPLGTGGAFWLAKPLIDHRFLLLYGDLYRPVDYARIAGRHPEASCLAVYPHVQGLTTIACANVGLDGDGRKVTVYAKDRPELGLTHVDAGFGLFDPDVLDFLPAGPSSFEACIYPRLASLGRLEAELVDRSFFDIGNPVDFLQTCKHFESLATRSRT